MAQPDTDELLLFVLDVPNRKPELFSVVAGLLNTTTLSEIEKILELEAYGVAVTSTPIIPLDTANDAALRA